MDRGTPRNSQSVGGSAGEESKEEEAEKAKQEKENDRKAHERKGTVRMSEERMKAKATITAYKVFNPDWTCLGFQYEVGKTYIHEGKLKPCESGFHACKTLASCFNYYDFDPDNKVARVELSGEVVEINSKIVASKIKIIEELDWATVLNLVNTGSFNTGNGNAGHWNSGSFNSGNHNAGRWNSGNDNTGDRNTGSENTGDKNSGSWNTGSRNSGRCNSGHDNEGDRNTGHGNSGGHNTGHGNSGDGNSGDGNEGDRNTGDYNSGNWNTGIGNLGHGNSGIFNTDEPFIRAFNKPTKMKAEDLRLPSLANYRLVGVDEDGQPVKRDYKQMWADGWDEDDDENKRLFFELPNFDLEIFEEITGIDAKEDYERIMGAGT